MTNKAIGFIFARGGSKGVPRKNIRPLAGKPLITYSIEAALQSKYIHRVVVSTDDKEIADVSIRYGADVPFMRPAELATDTASEWLAWRHAIAEVKKQEQFDIFVSIPATSPLRSTVDIDACVEKLLETECDIVITVKKAERNPYFNMVKVDEKGYASIVIMSADGVPKRRQDVPQVFDVTTVAYAARPDFVMNSGGLIEGKVQVVEVPGERAVDIDTELDFTIAECLMKHRKTQVK
jgi:N-acylneuraminate cytidylyltransferase